MMKNYLLKLSLLAILTIALPKLVLGQSTVTTNATPVRDILGIVKDTTNVGLPGVTVRLTSPKDSLITGTNPDGTFNFIGVKSSSYTISFNMLGFASLVAKYQQNPTNKKIVMDAVILKSQASTLNEVVINGTPAVTYKTDTVEYKASDYKVRENSTVDELVKKMEGMEVGTDGSLVHQGNNVVKAKINGKVYLGGDVATALQNLPAEIVEKIQIVDDYGDQAARTGVKDGDPEKILNIVTRADKSVGNTGNANFGVGNNERYQAGLFGTRINGGETIGINARINNTVNGVAASGDNGIGGGRGGNSGGGNNSAGGSGGTTNNGSGSLSYRTQVNKQIKVNGNYRYNFNNVNTLNSSTTYRPLKDGPLYISNDSQGKNNGQTHDINLEFEAEIDSSNYLKINPTLNYNSSISNSSFSTIQSGILRQDQIGSNQSKNIRPNYGATLFYQHLFSNKRRNISLQLSFRNNNQDTEQERNSNIKSYDNFVTDSLVKDSLVHRLVQRDNLQKNYRASMTYVEPLNKKSQLEFNGQINYNGYTNEALTSNIDAFNRLALVDSLSNIYDYSFTQSRLALNYRYGVDNDSKVKFSLGITAVPALLSGTKVSLGTTTNRSSFNLIPIARFQYRWSRQHNLQINYSGNANEPTFDQIQPVRDVSNPQNPIVGNPNLKATFTHSVNGNYNNYLQESKLNYSVNVNASFIDNAVVRNAVQIVQDSIRVYETRFQNASGVYNVGGNYSVSKQLSDRKYNLAINGNVNFRHNVSMSENTLFNTDVWSMNHRFGPRINPTEWLEVNPNAGYNYIKSHNTLLNTDNLTKTVSLNIDGKFIMWKSLIFGYSASKNFVSGIATNVTANPLVINSYLQKELWRRRATVTFQAFDLLNQNNFVNRNIADDGTTTDTRTNALSRYFMLRASLRLQKWSGARGRGGRPMRRNGDGGFEQF